MNERKSGNNPLERFIKLVKNFFDEEQSKEDRNILDAFVVQFHQIITKEDCISLLNSIFIFLNHRFEKKTLTLESQEEARNILRITTDVLVDIISEEINKSVAEEKETLISQIDNLLLVYPNQTDRERIKSEILAKVTQ